MPLMCYEAIATEFFAQIIQFGLCSIKVYCWQIPSWCACVVIFLPWFTASVYWRSQCSCLQVRQQMQARQRVPQHQVLKQHSSIRMPIISIAQPNTTQCIPCRVVTMLPIMLPIMSPQAFQTHLLASPQRLQKQHMIAAQNMQSTVRLIMLSIAIQRIKSSAKTTVAARTVVAVATVAPRPAAQKA